MGVNKVVFGEKVIMDTTEATVTPQTMVKGVKALGANGEMLTGTLNTAPLYNNLDQTNEGYALDARQGKVLDKKINSLLRQVYPVGSIYMSVNSTDPSTLFGGTWQRLKDQFLLAAGDSYAAGTTGGEARHTLTAAESGVPAHAHGLNSHKHSVGAHSHGLNSHTHTYNKPNTPTGSTAITANQMPAHSHHLLSDTSSKTGAYTIGANEAIARYATTGFSDLPYSMRPGTEGATLGITSNTGGGKGHTHTIGTTSTNTGTATGSTANSTAFDSGAATGNTANNTAANASSAHNNMPPYLAVYMWKRTA